MTNTDSYSAMLATVQAFHDKHDFKNTGGEELAYRIALMTEELGEISACVTQGKGYSQPVRRMCRFTHPVAWHCHSRGFPT